MFILLASELKAAALNTYLLPLFKCVNVDFDEDIHLLDQSLLSAGAGTTAYKTI